MAPPKISRKAAEDAAKAVAEEGNISAAARALGIKRNALQRRIDRANELGIISKPRAEANPSRWRPVDEIIAARKGEFARVKSAGDGRTLRTVHMPDDKPYCIVALGDPHLDSPGTDLDLWERWVDVLDYKRGVYGFGLGDWLDNWVRVLAHLYGNAETAAPEGWIILEHYLDQIAEHLIASVGGNHDEWSGHSDLLAHLMKERGVLHRNGSLRVALKGPNGRTVTIGARHGFPGRSQWSPVHGITKAAQLGWRDNILVGGHTHVSGSAIVRCPDTGRLTHCHQVASFKVADDYADDLGLMDKHISPAVALVIDPSRPDTDPQMVTAFYQPEPAVEYLKGLRRARAA